MNIMGIQTPATDDPDAIWDIYVFYVEYTISNRGKVLATNMERSREIQVFYWTTCPTLCQYQARAPASDSALNNVSGPSQPGF